MKHTLGSLLSVILIATKGDTNNLIPTTKPLNNAEYTKAFASAAQKTLLNRENSIQSAKIIEALIYGGHNSNELLSYQQAKNLVNQISGKLNNPLSVFQSPVIGNNGSLIHQIIDKAYRNSPPTQERATAISAH